ncbi:MAG: biotin synthase BioB [Nitrosomonadales bacterium]
MEQKIKLYPKKNQLNNSDPLFFQILELFSKPFNDLIFEAHTIHRENFDPNKVQLSTLLSIKTGGCSEDCGYCPQSSIHDTDVENEKILDLKEVIKAAKNAKASGASRFCMGAAWRSPKQSDLDLVKDMIKEVKKIGMESCVTLGMLDKEQTKQLKDVGLDYYNHNLDTSPEFYGEIISTRTYQDRLDTLDNVRDAGIHVCSGGIIGMGETIEERAGLIYQLASLTPQPESVPINLLTQVAGTPLFGTKEIDHFDFIRTIAVTRIVLPKSVVRLSAGRESMSDGIQALAFFAGANSIFYGDQLLTTENPSAQKDQELFSRLNLKSF